MLSLRQDASGAGVAGWSGGEPCGAAVIFTCCPSARYGVLVIAVLYDRDAPMPGRDKADGTRRERN